jgi:hypothetical protein
MEDWIKAIRTCIAESATADLESGSEETVSDDGDEEDIEFETSSFSKPPSSVSNIQTTTPTSTISFPPTSTKSLSSSKQKIQKKQ